MKKIIFLFVSTLISCCNLFANIQVDGINYQLDSANYTATVVNNIVDDVNYPNATDIVIPETITHEGVNYTVTDIGDGAFMGCSTLKTIELPNTVKYIGMSAFKASGLTQIIMPESVTEIVYNAFSACKSLTYVKISDNITLIPEFTFSDCTSLTTIEIGSGVERFGMMAFLGASAITEFTCHAIVPPTFGMMAFTNSIFAQATLNVPEESVEAYKNAEVWADFSVIKAIGTEAPEVTIIEVDGINYQLNTDKNTATVVRNIVDDVNYPNATDVVIPETITYNDADYTVTYLGDMAFSNCSTLTSVKLPETIDSIGFSAFYQAISLKQVDIPNSLVYLGWQAFGDCESLESIKVPDGVTAINDMTFSGCSSLKTVELGSGIEEIAMIAFLGAESITEFTCYAMVPPTFTATFLPVFSDVIYNVTTLNVPKGSEEAYQNAPIWGEFAVIKAIGSETPTSIIIENDGIKYKLNIENNTAKVVKNRIDYVNYPNATDVVIPETVTYNDADYTVTFISDKAFSDCYTLTSIKLPETVDSIGSDAFYQATSLKQIEIPSNIVKIGRQAFSHCESLESIEIPDGVTIISDLTFISCSSLKTVELGSNIESIGMMAFYGVDSVTVFTCHTIVPPICGEMVFTNSIYEQATLNVPEESVETYQNAPIWGEFSVIKAIGTEAPEVTIIEVDGINYQLNTDKNTATVVRNIVDDVNYPNATDVVIPETITYNDADYTVTYLGDMAFSNCSTLTSVKLPETIDSIGFSAFYQAISLKQLEIPSSLVYLGWQAFGYCESLESIEIPDGVTSISDMTFTGCSSLKTVELGSGIESIAMMAFLGAEAITEFTCHAIVPPTFTATFVPVFSDMIYNVATLIVPEGSVEAYKNAEVWGDFSNITSLSDSVGIIDNQTQQDVLIYSNSNTIYFDGLITEYQIFNISGVMVYQGSETAVTLSNGIYIVRINNQVKKVVL